MCGDRILKLRGESVFRSQAIIQQQGMNAGSLRKMSRHLAMTLYRIGNASATVGIDDHSIRQGIDGLGKDGRHTTSVDLLIGIAGRLGGNDLDLFQ
jgi:hypothetical protein